MSKPINIIKIEHTDRIGFDLINVLHSGKVSVLSATKSNDPCVVVAEMGDFRGEVIPVSGDVTIMNGDGVVLTEVSYEKLMSPLRIEELTEETLQPIREALSGGQLIDWEELNKRSEIPQKFPPLNPGGAIQGAESQQVTNGLSKLMDVYSKDLFLELFGKQASGLVIESIATHDSAYPGRKFTIFHRPDANSDGVIGYIMADHRVIFIVFLDRTIDTFGANPANLETFGLLRKNGVVEIKSMEGLIAFTTPRCGDRWSVLRKSIVN